jgi:seryl-tRNA synthetase
MIDIKLIREQTDLVKEGIAKKNFDTSKVDAVLELDKKRLELLQKVEGLRQERNTLTKENFERGKEIKEELKSLEPELEETEKKFKALLNEIPNLPSDNSPLGKGEEDNKELKVIGKKPQFSFSPKDHVELGKNLDILDFENGAKVSGSGFYYLKGAGALLEIALVNYGLQFLAHRGFTPIITPDLAREKFYLGTGYNPKGDEAQTYRIEESDLGLIATAEVTIAGYHADEIIQSLEQPKLYGGYSHCFRMESGAYGKYSKGLYRVHQFTKVEMFAYAKKEDSRKMHERFLELEEEFWTSLGIPYRVLEMCTGDLGSQAARKFDLEAWMPGRDDWGEVTSTSNTTDYQARNLNIRYREGENTEYAHMLNGTLVATSRAIIAILENFQQEDGSVKIPEVLVPFIGLSEIKLP